MNLYREVGFRQSWMIDLARHSVELGEAPRGAALRSVQGGQGLIRTGTVFVVGAGASCELGFPSGSALLEKIAQSLDFRTDGFRVVSGDRELHRVLQTLGTSGTPAEQYLGSAYKISNAAHLGLSIDNVIHQLDHDPLVPICAKLAITRQILAAENGSPLRIWANRRDAIELASIRATWLGRFIQLLVQDKQRSELADIFANVSVISFNYDRTIRRVMPFAIGSQFSIPDEEARALAATLRIYHPYGSLGPLPWEGPTDGVEFGDEASGNLVSVAKNLRTFTEQIEDGDELAEIRSTLSSAQRIVFLGFGYHRQNVELLTKSLAPTAKSILGTSMGLSDSDEQAVKGQLGLLFPSQYRGHKQAVLYPLPCVQFLDQNFRTLVS